MCYLEVPALILRWDWTEGLIRNGIINQKLEIPTLAHLIQQQNGASPKHQTATT